MRGVKLFCLLVFVITAGLSLAYTMVTPAGQVWFSFVAIVFTLCTILAWEVRND